MSSSCSTIHKRSKSDSDKNREFTTRTRTSYYLEKDICTSQKSECLRKSLEIEDDHQYSNNLNIDDSVGHQASLENDVKKLQMHLHQEKSMRLMLERAIGRASSTLSPGHRHFTAQTKELIAEIESLEEEIAKREQHVLFLYRSIFDQCISASSSRQSSGMSSPAHTKHVSRKHPSIISTTICSSQKFSLQPFQVLASIKESRNISALPKRLFKHEMLLNGKRSISVECNAANLVKLPTDGKTYMTHTLKDHLYQCPCKLSEELVKCMVAIYCWMHRDTSVKPEKVHSHFLSRSSTKFVLSNGGAGDGKELPCQSMVEISSISIDKNHLSNAAFEISKYRLLVEQLVRVDISALECGAKLAFWINMYNSLIMHAYLAYGVSHSSLRRLALFHKAAYNIGGHIITANSIEHSILHCRTPRVGRWFEAIISTAMRNKSAQEKQLISSNFSLFASQPLILFALCSGGSSDPMLRVYTEKSVAEELEMAKRDFLLKNVIIKKSRKIFLPKLLDRYAREARLTCEELVSWVSANVDKKLHDSIQKCINGKAKKAAQAVEWLPYNSKFRYVFGKDLTEKSRHFV